MKGAEKRNSSQVPTQNLHAKDKQTFKLYQIWQIRQFILRKIINIVATRFHILNYNAPKLIPLEKLSELPQASYLHFKGPTFKGRRKGEET